MTFLVYTFRLTDEVVAPQRIFIAFACGGLLGVLGALGLLPMARTG